MRIILLKNRKVWIVKKNLYGIHVGDKMLIGVRQCDKSQTLAEFIRKNTECGRAVFEKFNWDADWIIAKQKVPFIRKEGKICWSIATERVLMDDVIQTFQLSSYSTIEFEECSACGSEKTISKNELNIFIKQWESEYKLWKHNPRTKGVSHYLKSYIKSTGVYPQNVFAAIWLETGYSIDDFMTLFDLGKKQANKLLQAAGYTKKKCDQYYLLNYEYQVRIKKCFIKTKEIIFKTGYAFTKRAAFKRSVSARIRSMGHTIENLGDKIGFQENALARWIEPVYSERNALLNKIAVPLVVIILIVAGVGIGSAFFNKLVALGVKPESSMYSFWGSVFGAMIAGLITIITTYWIIKRSYQIDYHNERMEVLPVLSIEIVRRHFSNIEDTEFLSELKDKYRIYEHELFDDMMLMEITNIGSGIAFKIEVEGMWGDEGFFLSEVQKEKRKYIVTYDREDFHLNVRFYDVYGNLYMQTFESELSNKLCVSGNPPELVMRTKRIRYCQ